ncbi:hypothetical protein TTHERM_00646980 (macronuclear) [Tetrahymena thermophila SB210]|uniref:Uncharacterized protein n=1 Tax=Tetrahymena thermophila (strain SB210) TaxID=312017 RepID=I7MB22_TETTS|nr:hypothetical protein TTHERM_00646980 [Tetrahymena thermophila SB210]EAS07165.1 hypothetical protein TTHERM_00646980 [Tetrahymena thermophila SB210]|eukprot:XP_001027407.1 hypothetical protein TTHERM_00646980 [Tetrahymena thermophila SB210]
MIKKTKEGLKFCDQLIKENQVYQSVSTSTVSLLKANSQSALALCESLSPSKKCIEESSFGCQKVKKVVFQSKDNNQQHNSSIDEIKQQQRNKLIKQFPLPYSEQIPKKVEIQEICNFLRPRASSYEPENQKNNTSFNFPTSQSPKNCSTPNYIDKMVKENGRKLINQFSQMKQKQSLLDKITPRQYAWLTKQNAIQESPQNSKNFHKYAVIVPCQKNEDKQSEFTTKHYNSKNLIRMITSHFNEQSQDHALIAQNYQTNDSSNSLNQLQNKSYQNAKILPSFTFNQKKNQDNINNSIGNEIMITQINQSNAVIEMDQEDAQEEQNKNSQNQLQPNHENQQFKTKLNDPLQPRFLIFSKNLKQHQVELKKQEKEQYCLEKPDIVNTAFVNKLIMSAKHIQKIKGMHIQNQQKIQKLNENIKIKLEEKIEKQREVARPPSREQIEFKTYMKEFDKNKAESQKRKQQIIYDLQVNQERRVIWKNFNVSNLSRSKSPPKQQSNQNKISNS